MSNVYIMGFIGSGNLGDEAILAGTIIALRQAGHEDVRVFSWSPQETKQQHGVTSLPVQAGWDGVKVFRSHLKRGDLFLLGGGSLLQDSERRIVPFWLSRAVAAKWAGCTVIYHAQGVGPLTTFMGRLLVNLLVPFTANLVTLRDADSFSLVPSSSRPRLVADPALLLPPLAAQTQPKRVVVAVREVKGLEDQEKDLAACLAHFAKRNELDLLFVPFHHPDDCALSYRMARLSGGKSLCERIPLQDMRKLLASAEMVVAMRLHASILAAGVLTPVVGLSYDPKVTSFFSQMGIADAQCAWSEEFSYQKFLDILDREYHSRDTQRQKLEERIPPLRERASEAVQMALEAWKRKK